MAKGSLYYWVANWNLSRAQAALLLHHPVVDMVDMIHANVNAARNKYLKQGIRHFGGYVTGSSDIRWTTEDWSSFPPGVVLWEIDQSNLDLPLIANAKKVVDDVEAGAKTIGQAVNVAEQRIAKGDDLIVYMSQSVLPEVESAMHHRGLPNGTIIAYQYAGGDKTGGLADLSVVLASHFQPAPPPSPAPRAWHSVVSFDRPNEGWGIVPGVKAQGRPGRHATVTYDERTEGWSIRPGAE